MLRLKTNSRNEQRSDMKPRAKTWQISFSLCVLALCNCSHYVTPPEPAIESVDYAGIERIVYSRHVQPIFNQKCSSQACHNSRDRAAGLELTSWRSLIRGSDYGAVLISGSAEESHLIEHLNEESKPRMPLGRDPLPQSVIDFLSRWIDEGARNDAGERPYENLQKKIYVANQGDDLVSVISSEHHLVTRLLPVGASPTLDVPHNICVDHQKKFLYAALTSAGEVWKFDVAADSLVGRGRAGNSPAHVVVTADGAKAYVTNWEVLNQRGLVQVLDAAALRKTGEIEVGIAPHGLNFSHDGKLLYVACYVSDVISIVRVQDDQESERVLLAPDVRPGQSLKYQPVQVVLTPDDRFAYVSCAKTDEVRVLDTAANEIVAAVRVGKEPFQLQVAPDGEFVYVANRGSNNVSVIRVADNQVTATIESGAFANPHGVAFSADGRFAYITNENVNGRYNAHHPGEQGGAPGNLQVIDTATLQVVKTIEVEASPTGVVCVER